ncbi:MAG: hypothetical protein KJZ55_08895, partial [Flavobacteriales bacterium]|nr:hypothetical protein [Flavobacteriales bacterium]
IMSKIKLFILLSFLFVLITQCSKKEKESTPTPVGDNPTVGNPQISFTKVIYTSCQADFIYSISYNYSNSFVVPVGVTPIAGCGLGVNLSLKTGVDYKFTFGKTSNSSQVYNADVTFRDDKGTIKMDIKNIVSPNGYTLILKDNCSNGTQDLVIK